MRLRLTVNSSAAWSTAIWQYLTRVRIVGRYGWTFQRDLQRPQRLIVIQIPAVCTSHLLRSDPGPLRHPGIPPRRSIRLSLHFSFCCPVCPVYFLLRVFRIRSFAALIQSFARRTPANGLFESMQYLCIPPLRRRRCFFKHEQRQPFGSGLSTAQETIFQHTLPSSLLRHISAHD